MRSKIVNVETKKKSKLNYIKCRNYTTILLKLFIKIVSNLRSSGDEMGDLETSVSRNRSTSVLYVYVINLFSQKVNGLVRSGRRISGYRCRGLGYGRCYYPMTHLCTYPKPTWSDRLPNN